MRQPSGHLVFYGSHGRRILATDPDGNPLHECEWMISANGTTKLARARIHLDWGQWVGIKPEGLIDSTVLDLSKKPGWEHLQPDDLRRMAAQALQVPFEAVKFFYGDEDLVIDEQGRATIRHKKDAFYVLEDGTFERARFMACMGAMHWSRIDFLPVVELFQSLLPGTGSATLELIRGLYDDQNEGLPQPLTIRYRGIPPYPSEAAFRLFSAFFMATAPGGGDPFPIFMDPSRSHEVSWLPAPDPPRRYFDAARRLCLTVKGNTLHKATLADDPAGLPFVNPGRSGFAPCERSVGVRQSFLVLRERGKEIEIPINPAWGLSLAPEERGEGKMSSFPLGWRDLFKEGPPQVSPFEAFSAVLLYPEDETEIEEVSSQPFVADHLQDMAEQSGPVAAHLARTERVLIDNFDGALTACIDLHRPRDYTVLYHRPAFAQKHAQLLWNQLAQTGRVNWANRMALKPKELFQQSAYGQRYDLIYTWIPFVRFEQPTELDGTIRAIARALASQGLAFVVGPSMLGRAFQKHDLRLLATDPVEALPTFRMHQTILPKAHLKPGLTLFHVIQG